MLIFEFSAKFHDARLEGRIKKPATTNSELIYEKLLWWVLGSNQPYVEELGSFSHFLRTTDELITQHNYPKCLALEQTLDSIEIASSLTIE